MVLISVLLYWYCRCWRSTAVTVLTCLLTVACQLGLLSLLGFGLDPYSILVPFLIFAIGISHAVQNINLMMSEMDHGHSPIEASRRTFRALFIPGTTALLADAVGFITLLVIDIGVIQQLAITASIGVFVAISQDVPAAGADVASASAPWFAATTQARDVVLADLPPGVGRG